MMGQVFWFLNEYHMLKCFAYDLSTVRNKHIYIRNGNFVVRSLTFRKLIFFNRRLECLERTLKFLHTKTIGSGTSVQVIRFKHYEQTTNDPKQRDLRIKTKQNALTINYWLNNCCANIKDVPDLTIKQFITQ